MPILTAEERVGTLLGGRYRLEDILGSGGTSTVYRALHTFTNRLVAVKVLKPEHARDRGLVARFLKEARIASTVVHPHVVTILDMGTDADCTYLAMELVDGESLAARLAQGPLDPGVAITLLRPLMEAVAVAHDKGIVHRDIKPENVLVGDRGDGVERAVLLDFGMAKTTESAWGHMTQSGVLVGTPYYMSPEQAEGVPDVAAPTDVWSMGVLLYRTLSGDLPFTGATPTALLLAIARGDHVPLGEAAPQLDPALAAWVEGALVTDRVGRYADMRAMLAALDEALAGTVRRSTRQSTSGIRAVPAEPSTPARPSRTWIYVAAALAALLTTAAVAAVVVGGGDETPAVEVPAVAVVVAPPVVVAPTIAALPTPAPIDPPAVIAPPVEVPSAPETAPPRGRAVRGGDTARTRVTTEAPPIVETPPAGGGAHGLVTEW